MLVPCAETSLAHFHKWHMKNNTPLYWSLNPTCFGCVHVAIAFATASTSLSQKVEPKEMFERVLTLFLDCVRTVHQRKPSPHTQCAHSSCHTVLRHELVETEIRECRLHNHVYSTQDFRIRGNISPQETEPQQLTQHLHEPVVERNHESKNSCFFTGTTASFDVQSVCCAISER